MKIIITAYQGTDEQSAEPVYLVVLEPAEGEVPDPKAMRDAAGCKVNAFSMSRFEHPGVVLHDLTTGLLPSGVLNEAGVRLLEREDTVQLWQIEHSGDLNPNGPAPVGETLH